MTILFFDTETTGLPSDRFQNNHPDQPYIVQLAAQLCRDDGRPIAGISLIVDPGIGSSVAIPKQASDVHGITDEIAAQFGVSSEYALNAFAHLYQRADLVCAHNVKFDKWIMEIAIARHYGREKALSKPLYCTMEAAAPIVNLPPTERMKAAGIIKPKAPKLSECIRHFFGEELEDAHDAMVDLAACRRVYLRLREIEGAPTSHHS